MEKFDYEDFILWLVREGYISYAEYFEIMLRLENILQSIEFLQGGGRDV